MTVKPILGDWEIPNIEAIETTEQRSFAELEVPGRVGSLFHDMNTRPTGIIISGSLFGEEKRNQFLEDVRSRFHEGVPITFVADIVTATEVQYVIVENLLFRESSLHPDVLHYFIRLQESPPPPPPPDPLGGLDTSLLDQAGDFLDSVTGALDALDLLGSVPDIGDPTVPLSGALSDASGALGQLEDLSSLINDLFGDS